MQALLRALMGALLLCFSLVVSADLLDINTADADVIAETMVGIGPAKALEIVRYRDEHGPFLTLDQLSQVKGVGIKTVEQNRDKVVAVVPDVKQ